MKKTLITIFATLIVFSMITSQVYAGESFDNMMYRLGRGLTNVITGPLEIMGNIDQEVDQSGIYKGIPYGLVKGIPTGVIRIIVGLYETVTFPIEQTENNAPLLEPEFVYEKNINQ